MAMSPPSITTKRPEWVFYTPYTVRVKTSNISRVTLTLRRSWSALRTVGLDTVLHDETLVLSLLFFTRPRGNHCSFSSGNFSFQNARGWVSLFSRYMHTSLSCVVVCLLEIGQHPQEEEVNERSAYRQILGLPAVHLMALFIFVYGGYISAKTFPALS